MKKGLNVVIKDDKFFKSKSGMKKSLKLLVILRDPNARP
jgi:hypothetical protein